MRDLKVSKAAELIRCDQRTLDAIIQHPKRHPHRPDERMCRFEMAAGIAGLLGMGPEILDPQRAHLPLPTYQLEIQGKGPEGLPTVGEAAVYIVMEKFWSAAMRDFEAGVVYHPRLNMTWEDIAKKNDLASAREAFALYLERHLPSLFSAARFRFHLTGGLRPVDVSEADPYMVGAAKMVLAGLEHWFKGRVKLNWASFYSLVDALSISPAAPTRGARPGAAQRARGAPRRA